MVPPLTVLSSFSVTHSLVECDLKSQYGVCGSVDRDSPGLEKLLNSFLRPADGQR